MLFLLFVISLAAVAQNKIVKATMTLPQHPRILLLRGGEKVLKNKISKDPFWKDMHAIIISEADNILYLSVNERIKIGRRLLGVSRENLRRIFMLSYAYRMTGMKKYLDRAEKEMLKAASFPDWNPTHFLDVAEMTMAMSIGYDWLYSGLSSASKKAIEKAIVEKGLNPSFDTKFNGFLNVSHNWNQVCNSSMAYGAIALWEKNPKFAAEVINRSFNSIVLPMKEYAPDGAYPEGVGYWDYGTTFNVLFLSAMENLFGHNDALYKETGFLKTGEYVLQMVTPSLYQFNYSDNGQMASLEPAMFWFLDKIRDASIIYSQVKVCKRERNSSLRNNRFLPAILLWGAGLSMDKIVTPKSLFWKANGDNPVCGMRSSWTDPNASFLGVKLGSPKVNHGHMDVGSFVFESEGVNWAIDLGAQNYEYAESKGVDLWNMAQDSQRWDVYRYNNLSHNTLSFNLKYQKVEGKAEFLDFSDKEDSMSVQSDLTPVYQSQIQKVVRSFSLLQKSFGMIEDRIEAGKNFTMVTWRLVTPSAAKVISDKEVLLEKDGKKLFMRVETEAKIRWHVRPAQSDFPYDSPNVGISIVSFDVDLRPYDKQNIKVYLVPGNKINSFPIK